MFYLVEQIWGFIKSASKRKETHTVYLRAFSCVVDVVACSSEVATYVCKPRPQSAACAHVQRDYSWLYTRTEVSSVTGAQHSTGTQTATVKCRWYCLNVCMCGPGPPHGWWREEATVAKALGPDWSLAHCGVSFENYLSLGPYTLDKIFVFLVSWFLNYRDTSKHLYWKTYNRF